MARLRVGELIQALERKAPSATAESWDNVGLLAGDTGWVTPGAVVAIDLTEKTIQAAKARGYRLIVNHHPCIFPASRGLSRITADPQSGKTALILEALRQGIAIAAWHTNFDRCAVEVADRVSRGLGLVPRGRLIEKGPGSCVKLVVFVPETHLDVVRQALADTGAGQIGDYDSCSFTSAGEGRFRGSNHSRPFLGKPGQLESAREHRLETILPRGLEGPVLSALRAAHPYEEIAYDLYPVEQGPSPSGMVRGIGYGFWGEFPEPRPFSELCNGVKTLFKANGFLLTTPYSARPSRIGKIQKVGFAAGNGSSVIQAAASVGCDLLITGEAGYHPALSVTHYRPARPMTVMELGHRESERFFVTVMRDWLKETGIRTIGLHVRTQTIRKFAPVNRSAFEEDVK